MENNNFETFVLYYTLWHEGDGTIYDMKKHVIAEIGEDGFAEAIEIFRQKRLEREAAGSKKTLYQEMHGK